MKTALKILIPTNSTAETNYFKGFIRHSQNETILYVTKFATEKELLSEDKYLESDVLYGAWDTGQLSMNKQKQKFAEKHSNWLVICKSPELNIKQLYLKGNKISVSKCTVIYYDHQRIVDSEVKWEFDDIFSKLQTFVKNESEDTKDISYSEPLLKYPSCLKSSMLIDHIFSYMNTIYWALATIKRDKKISIKHGNFILSIIIDLLLGYIVLEFLKQDKKELSVFLMSLLEKMINMLNSLLKWLMGAPAGLKLNNAFNKMLGKYFSYHVQLWWLFFDVTGEKLSVILDIFYCLGYFGFTFQAAVISDLISIVTFHSFCIYVYAARMFNIQILGLIALMRFFVGRKYNPLRNCIDSCEYSNQELFVGTVAFTILLLLLPTTAMYYIVFTLFRLLTLLVQHALAKLIYHLHTLPLYVGGLWLFRSPKVAGNVLLEVMDDNKGYSPLIINLRLFNKSLYYLLQNFCPPCNEPKKLEWAKMLSNIFIGKPII